MKTRNMLLLLAGFAASAAACTSTRTVEVVTKPAPAAPAVVVESVRPSHYRLVAIDDRRAEAVFEPVVLSSEAVTEGDIAIQRQSGMDQLRLPIDRLSDLLNGDGMERAIEIEEGTLFDAFYSGDGKLERLAVHAE